MPLALLTLLLAFQIPLIEAQKALDADKPAVAEPLLRQAIATDPNDYFAHFNLGLALSMQNKDQEAIQEFRQTLHLKPGLYEASLNLGIVLLRTKQFEDATPVLKQAAEAKPADPVPNYYYGQALLETGHTAEAKQHFSIDLKSARNHYGLARAYLKESNLAEAATHYREAASLDLDYKNNLLDLAAEYEKARQIPQAIAIYSEFPDNPAAQKRIADLEAYQKAATPDPFEDHMNRGKALRDEHKYIPAANEFFAATKIHPESLPAWK
jgi:tetratricopeptide (TPR) repeat protein